LRKINGLT